MGLTITPQAGLRDDGQNAIQTLVGRARLARQNDDKFELAKTMRALKDIVGPVAAEQLIGEGQQYESVETPVEEPAIQTEPDRRAYFNKLMEEDIGPGLSGIGQTLRNIWTGEGEGPLPDWLKKPFDLDGTGGPPSAFSPSNAVGDTMVPEGTFPDELTEDEESEVIDSFGVTVPAGGESTGTGTDPGQAIKDAIESDPSRSTGRWNPDAEHDVGRITPVDEGKFLGGLRKKVGGFFGHESEEELQRFGSALTGFGSGVLTGGTDLGAAMGHGFAKAHDQFVATKNSQRNASLADHKVAREDERLERERWLFEEKKKEVARARTMQGIEDQHNPMIKVDPETGAIVANPNYRASTLPDKYKELEATTIAIMKRDKVDYPTAKEEAKEILGIKPREAAVEY